MSYVNTVILSGVVAKEPKTGTSKNGVEWARLTIVMPRGKLGEKFFNIFCWAENAEIVKSLTPGTEVKITGHLDYQWRPNGSKRPELVIVANTVQVIQEEIPF